MEDIFFRIIMKTKDGKTLYLKAGIGKSCKWDFDKNEAIWFETLNQAENFVNTYFKNFKNYTIQKFFVKF